jgi:hypothetical protein
MKQLPLNSSQNIIVAYSNLSQRISAIEEKNKQARKRNKKGFNFFYAIVHKNTHLEKYHTNFIRYLLDPSEEHDCDSFFLYYFLQAIKEKLERISDTHPKMNLINSWLQFEDLHNTHVTLEKQISNGRIDIELLNKKSREVIFIENKVRSSEGFQQMIAYYEHYKREYPDKCLGVYLTKNGHLPQSTNSNGTASDTIIPLSYKDIIVWLEMCVNKELYNFAHISFAIEQYIYELKKELIMVEDQEIKELQEHFTANPNDLWLLVRNKAKMNFALEAAICQSRKNFQCFLIEDLFKQLKACLPSYGYKFNNEGHKHFIVVFHQETPVFRVYLDLVYPNYEEGGRGLWWGIYDINDKPFNFPIGILRHCWEGVYFDTLEDYYNDDRGSEKIIELQLDPKKRVQVIREIVQNIVIKIKDVVIPALQNNGKL